MACGGPCDGGPCTCGCCAPAGPATPLALWNRPGLSQLDYRVGTYGSFRRAMLQAGSRHPDLRSWTARNDEDYGIALVSMWAYVADVLTFYGERAVHEAFLGTAIHDRSLRRLAAMLDYLPAPGAAATAHLAYVAEAGKRFEVRPGMRVQSVPGQDERPQKFEPVETVAVEPALNRVRVHPQPVPATPAGGATLAPAFAAAGPDLAAGDKLVAVAGAAVEEKRLDGVEQVDWRTLIHWQPATLAAGAALYKWRRKMRLFGYNAPDPWLKSTVSEFGFLTWESVAAGQQAADGTDYDFEIGGTQLRLDGLYDLGPGATVLVTGTDSSNQAFARLRQVAAVDSDAATLGPLSASVTRLSLDSDLGVTADRRKVTVYELVEVVPGEVEIALWDHAYGDEIAAETAAETSAVWVRGGDASALLPGVEKGRRLVLSDAAGEVQTVSAIGPPVVQDFGGVAHLGVSFEPPLAAPLDAATAVLAGNVAAATHGETVAGEVLGSGDAARTFQRFAVAKPRVTHVPDPTAEHGARSTLEVRVDGVLWHPVRGFYGVGPEERVYVERQDEEGRSSVRFGDGRTGARVSSGKNNVTATYRHGLGLAGRVEPSALRVALDRPPGLKSVANPAPSFGGADPESGERVRDNAANGVRTFGRIVSLADFEDAAREYAGVAKARAVERWVGEERGVWLFVAGDEGAALEKEGLADLLAYLDLRRDPHRRLTVRDFTPVYVLCELNVESHPDHEAEVVTGAVAAALADGFAFENRGLGAPVHLSDLYRTAQEVDGVVGVDFDRLSFKHPAALKHLDRRELRFGPAGPLPLQPRLLLFADELAAVETAAQDVVVNRGIPGAGSAA